MKGFELVKHEDHWALYNEDGHKIAATLPGCNSKLSIKNCEAIANGYDLDELADESANQFMDGKDHFYGFKAGFQKALEILGDKKFSEDDIKKAFNVGWIQRHNEQGSHYEVMGKVIQSLQQTEWDVEVELDAITTDDISSIIGKLKLDTEGCLILRRI